MNVLLFGYGEVGCAGLEFLLANGERIVGVVTHRDDPKEKRWYRSLADRAKEAGVPVSYGEDHDPFGLADLARRSEPDILLSFYYRNMIPTEVLAIPSKGALNLHGSLLPRLRGRAPINWALVECEERTGVTLHHMVKAPDAGDIVAQRGWEISSSDTAKTLFDRAVAETQILLAEVWPQVVRGTAPRIPQDPAKATYRGRRRPEDGRIDWTQTTKRIDGLVRAVTDPFPGAFTFLGGRKLLVWAGRPAIGRGEPGTVIDTGLVATGDGAYEITRSEFVDATGEPPRWSIGCRLGEQK